MTTDTKPALFWGNRYQVRKAPYGKSQTVWHIVDTARGTDSIGSLDSTKAHAQEEADKLNANPAANYNGYSFPKAYFATRRDPEEFCDCQDPAPREGAARNVCGAVVGTFCKTHGAHDECPRAIRGVTLTTDPQHIADQEKDLARRREDLARSAAYLAREEDRLDRLARLARRYSV